MSSLNGSQKAHRDLVFSKKGRGRAKECYNLECITRIFEDVHKRTFRLSFSLKQSDPMVGTQTESDFRVICIQIYIEMI